MKIQYYHNDYLWTPRELTNKEGEITREAQYTTWGNKVQVNYQETNSNIPVSSAKVKYTSSAK